MEINRLGRELGHYVLDGVIVVIDVENWKGYEDTSYTAKMQQKYTDLIVFNKWELVSERRYDDCLDRVGDLDLQVACVKSEKGRVDQSVLMGLDSALAKSMAPVMGLYVDKHGHDHSSDHQSEVEVLSVSLISQGSKQGTVDLDTLEMFLLSAPKDEIYRIKAILAASRPPASSTGSSEDYQGGTTANYILNWAFGRWTFTPIKTVLPYTSSVVSLAPSPGTLAKASATESLDPVLRMTIILARHEAEKWKKRIEAGGLVEHEGEGLNRMPKVERIV